MGALVALGMGAVVMPWGFIFRVLKVDFIYTFLQTIVEFLKILLEFNSLGTAVEAGVYSKQQTAAPRDQFIL